MGSMKGAVILKNLALNFRLKPETRRMLLLCGAVFCLLYTAAFLCYAYAGSSLDYQQGLIISERLAKGLRAGIGITCIGVLVMECR